MNWFLVKNKIIYRKRALIVLQKTIKGYLTRKRHGPRIKALAKIKGVESNLKKMESIAGQLKKDKDAMANEINKLKNEITATIDRIKVSLWSARCQKFLTVCTNRKTIKLNQPLSTVFTLSWLPKWTNKWERSRRRFKTRRTQKSRLDCAKYRKKWNGRKNAKRKRSAS
jgi:hypothetical protein